MDGRLTYQFAASDGVLGTATRTTAALAGPVVTDGIPPAAGWSLMDSRTTTWLNGIRGISSSDVFAVGQGGIILHYGVPGMGAIWAFSAAGFFPKHLPDAYTGTVVLADLDLADIPDEVQGVWWWDGEEWIFWVPGVGGDLTNLAGQGFDYMVLVSAACSWTMPLP